MKNNPTGILISSTLILIIIVFFKWEGDMTFRFSSVVLLFNSIGLQFVDKKLKKIIALFFVQIGSFHDLRENRFSGVGAYLRF